MPSAGVERPSRILSPVNQLESPPAEPPAEATAAPPVDGREGTTLLKFQFLIFSGLLALLVPGPFVLGNASLSPFYWAALSMHLVFAAWLFMGDRRLLAASLAVAAPVLLTPWLAYGLRVSLGVAALVSGPILFALLLLLGIAIGRKFAAGKAD